MLVPPSTFSSACWASSTRRRRRSLDLLAEARVHGPARGAVELVDDVQYSDVVRRMVRAVAARRPGQHHTARSRRRAHDAQRRHRLTSAVGEVGELTGPSRSAGSRTRQLVRAGRISLSMEMFTLTVF